VYRDMGRPGEARLAANALVALGAATPEELELVRVSPPRPGRAGEGSVGPKELAALAIERVVLMPATALLASCAESLAKIFPTDVARLGLSRKDRLGRGNAHPLRGRIDELCGIFGVAECDAYVHAGAAPLVTVGLTDPVSVIVSERVGSLPEAQQVFHLARALAGVSLGVHPALVLPAPDLGRILAAAARAVLPNFGGPSPEIEDLAHRIRKAQSRRWRKAQEVAAEEYAAAPLADARAWQRAILGTLNRAAAVLADDLAAAMAGLAVTDDAGDLLRFWMSEPARSLRVRTALAR
jgi:hypothetical protein